MDEVDCCIAGGGPAGAMLALLLARQGVRVMLLEAHGDFDREFRGDTIHPSVLEILDQIGLADRLLELPHHKLEDLRFLTPTGPVKVIDFHGLRTRFPYILLVPQVRFLEFITAEAARYPNFHLELGARVDELVEQDGVVRGVRFRGRDGSHEVRATLTVAADGRFSTIRHLLQLEPVRTAPPMDVVWFRLPRTSEDAGEGGAQGRIGHGALLIALDRGDQWQMGLVIPKGGYGALHAAGIGELRRRVAELAPEFADRLEALTDWHGVAVLSVESSRLRQWYAPGLLLIGDAAHVMSPVFGVGINYAIQDAVVAANLLTGPLKEGRVPDSVLEAVQQQREWPIRVIQFLQGVVQQRVVTPALRSKGSLTLPPLVRLLLRFPPLARLLARTIAFGVRRVRLVKT